MLFRVYYLGSNVNLSETDTYQECINVGSKVIFRVSWIIGYTALVPMPILPPISLNLIAFSVSEFPSLLFPRYPD